MTADRAGGGRDVGAELGLVMQHRGHAFLVHDHHDQVYFLGADLEAHTASFDPEKYGSAPSRSIAAGGHPFTVRTAHDEAAFFQRRHNRDAIGLADDLFRDPLIGGDHDVVKDLAGALQAIQIACAAVGVIFRPNS